MNKTLLLSLILTSFFSSLIGQTIERCAHKTQTEKAIKLNPELQEQLQKNEKTLARIINQQKAQRTTTEENVYTIPLVIHIIHTGEAEGVGTNISDAQIKSGVDQLNAAFRNNSGLSEDIKIQFRLARKDPDCNPTDGIVRINGSGLSGYSANGVYLNSAGADEVSVKDLSRWAINDYYNIWIVSEFDNNNGGNGTQGFAYFPEFVNPDRDGAMIMHTAWGNQGTANSWNNMGTTGIHEIGHALNLYHTFEGDEDGNGDPQCPPDGCGSNLGDCCDDTSPHQRSNSDCPVSEFNSCTGFLNDDVINNYMDYSSQVCNIKFTADQKDRMRAALTEFRSGLLVSKGLDSTLSYTPPIAASCYPQTSGTGLSANYAGILKVQLNNLVYSSGYAKADGGSLDLTATCHNSTELVIGASYDMKVTVGTNTNVVYAWIDYNNNGAFSASEQVFTQTLSNETGTQSITIPASATKDTYLRMRVMNDIGSITSACENPTYGQAEDYAVIIRTTASNSTASNTNFEVYPNPAQNEVIIDGLERQTSVNYQLTDQLGNRILSGVTTGEGEYFTLNISHLPTGIYFISIRNGQTISTKKVTKL